MNTNTPWLDEASALATPLVRRPSRADTTALPRWLPRLEPAALAAIISLAAVFVGISLFPLHATDVWGHLVRGRNTAAAHGWSTSLATGTAQATSRAELPWLAQWLFYGAQTAGGAAGLVALHAALVASTCGVVMVAARAQGARGRRAVAAPMAYLLLALPIVGTMRPQLAGVLCAAFGCWCWSASIRQPRALWCLPALFALWSNLHGSVAWGLVLLGAWIVGELYDSQVHFEEGAVSQTARQRRTILWWLGPCCAVAVMAHPLGWRVYPAWAEVLGNPLLREINEWRPLTLGSLSAGLLAASGLLMAGGVLYQARRQADAGATRLRTSELLLLLATGVAAIVALRMLVWWAVICPWIAARWCAGPNAQATAEDEQTGAARRAVVATVALFLALIWSPPTHGWITGQMRSEADLLSPETPYFLAAHAVERQATGRLWTTPHWAEYFEFVSVGRLQPLVDTHVHQLTQATWRDARQIGQASPDWLAVVDRHQVRWLALDSQRHARLFLALQSVARAKIRYQDQQGVLVEILPRATDAAPDFSERALPGQTGL